MTVLKPHAYQELGTSFLQSNDRAALWLDMGLGKTMIVLRALTPAHLPALVVAPKRVAEHVWAAEALKWRPDLRVQVCAGSARERNAALRRPADIHIIGRDNLADAHAKDLARRWSTFIMDESSSFKTKSSGRWKAARRLALAKFGTRHVWELTGTPSPNGLLDIWAQAYLLDEGARLGTTLGGYRGRYFMAGRQLPNGVITEWIIREGADARIHQKMEDLALSIDTASAGLDLPPYTVNIVETPLPAAVRQQYKTLKKDLVLSWDDVMGDQAALTAGTAAILTTKLQQMTAGFVYQDNGETRTLHHEKTRAVQEIVEGTGGSPVLVFYRFQAELEALRTAMPYARTMAQFDQDDWDAGRIPVLLAHPQGAGHGLNLQHGGHTAVWTSLTWSLEEWQQANKRLLRQGQKHPVVTHVLVAPQTVDRGILDVLDGKEQVQEALLDHLRSPL